MDGRDRPAASISGSIERRHFLGLVGASAGMLGLPRFAAAQGRDVWDAGQLAHLIPTASHDRFLIKASFKASLTKPPRLSVDGKLSRACKPIRTAGSGASTRNLFSPPRNTS